MKVFILPVIFSIVFFIVFVILIIVTSKASKSKNLFVNMDEQFEDLRKNAENLSKQIFNTTLVNETTQKNYLTCEYCGSELPEKTTKCPNCSANVKRNKK